jgi:16S rRNA C967 or C1407 C5-methylase (RsmB/RsmF family)/NOL1/NOP2/fmu family ribosome biogenesis protein
MWECHSIYNTTVLKQLPEQLLNDLLKAEGFDKPSFLHAHEQPAVTSIRVHPVKGTEVPAYDEQVSWCAQGRYLNQRPVFTVDPLYHAGAYYVQEASSMFLSHVLRSLLPERDNLRVLDLCAAPGGKSTLIASLLGSNSLLLSNEVIRTRASILEENMTRWGYANTWVCSNDPKDIGKLIGYFDVIVVDAPCSGSGLFRKDERALDEWSSGNVALCSQRQHRILADVWPALKEGGLLVYATCSYSPQEDEEVLDWLAETYEIESLPVTYAKEWGIIESKSVKGITGYRFYPGKVKGEGFFIAAVKKCDAQKEVQPPKFKPVHDKKVFEQASFLVDDRDYACLKADKDNYAVINPSHEADWHLLSKSVYLRKTGLQIGSPAGKDWIPAHEIALSINKGGGVPCIDVSKEQALRFLKKEDMDLQHVDKGWYIIRYNGLGLGWVKSIGNRFNNYLPKHWRIRMDISDADWA